MPAMRIPTLSGLWVQAYPLRDHPGRGVCWVPGYPRPGGCVIPAVGICAAGAVMRMTGQTGTGGSATIILRWDYLAPPSALAMIGLPRCSAARPSRVRSWPLTVGQSGQFYRLLGESHARNTCPVSVHSFPGLEWQSAPPYSRPPGDHSFVLRPFRQRRWALMALGIPPRRRSCLQRSVSRITCSTRRPNCYTRISRAVPAIAGCGLP